MPASEAAKAPSSDRRGKSTALIDARPSESQTIRPIYIRLPAPGSRCPWTGLSRSALADLCVPSKANRFRPPVKSIAPKKHKDAERAMRLIVFESLISYLRQFEEEAAA
jgi:hypothetical protein